MNVEGHEIPQVVIDAVKERMKAGPFRAAELIDVANKHGLRGEVAMRFVDRYIQSQRKAGNIELSGTPRRWTWKVATT